MIRGEPKILSFDKSGNVSKTRALNKYEVVNFKNIKITKNYINWLNKNMSSSFASWNSSALIDKVHDFLESAVNWTKLKKTKILTRCTEQGICRFLQCINIRTHCMLCEVKMKYKNATTCYKVSTKFLSGHVD